MRLYGTMVERCRICRAKPQYGTGKMCFECQRVLWGHPDLRALALFLRKWYFNDGA